MRVCVEVPGDGGAPIVRVCMVPFFLLRCEVRRVETCWIDLCEVLRIFFLEECMPWMLSKRGVRKDLFIVVHRCIFVDLSFAAATALPHALLICS